MMILVIIESPLFNCCKECACCEKGLVRDEPEMDDDVLVEEERINNMNSGGKYQIKVD